MRLIDADALKKEWGMGEKCEECPQNAWKCQYEQNLTQMDICQMIDEAPTVSGWVSVKDKLPDKPCGCLVFNKYGWIALDRWEGDSWILTEESEITHWMLLPEPPKEEDEHDR